MRNRNIIIINAATHGPPRMHRNYMSGAANRKRKQLNWRPWSNIQK